MDAVNRHIEEYAAQQGLLYVDCSPRFLLADGSGLINRTLMPDGMHPTGAGGQLLAECFLGALQQALASRAN